MTAACLPLMFVMAYVGGAALATGHHVFAVSAWAIALGCDVLAFAPSRRRRR